MYAKSCLAFLAASWVFLGTVPVGAHGIVAGRDLAELRGRDATATAVVTRVSSSCHASLPASGGRNDVSSPSRAAAASSMGICPLASGLCAACPVSTTTVTVSSCPSSSAGRGAPGTGTRDIPTSVPSIHPSSSEPLSTNRTTTSAASPARPSSTTLDIPSTRSIQSSAPLIGSSTAHPAIGPTGSTLRTLTTRPGAGGASGASGAGPGSTVTPRAAVPPGIVRRQLVGVMNITAPFANTSSIHTSSIHTNATSTLNVTRILTSATTSDTTGTATGTATAFRFHLRNRM